MINSTQKNTEKATRVITAAAFISIFSFSLAIAFPATLINYIVHEFNLYGVSEGLMASLVSIGFVLSFIIVPLIAGHIQKVSVIIAACVLQVVFLLVGGAAPTFLFLGIACVFLGIAGGFIDAIGNSAIVDVRKSDSPKYLGFLHGLFSIGSLLAPLLFLRMLLFTDWRGIFFIMAATSLLAVMIIYMISRNSTKKGFAPSIRESKFNKADLCEYLRRKRNIALALTALFSMISWAGAPVWIVRYMTLRFDAPELGAIALSATWLCATINRFFFSQTIKRAPMRFFILGAVLYAVFLAAGVISYNAIVLLVMFGLLGFCGGHFVPVLVSECAIGYEGKTSFTTSFIMFLMGGSRIVTPLLIAFVGTQVSLTFSMMIPAITALAAVFFAVLSMQYDKTKNI